jgi:hypothetical protein
VSHDRDLNHGFWAVPTLRIDICSVETVVYLDSLNGVISLFHRPGYSSHRSWGTGSLDSQLIAMTLGCAMEMRASGEVYCGWGSILIEDINNTGQKRTPRRVGCSPAPSDEEDGDHEPCNSQTMAGTLLDMWVVEYQPVHISFFSYVYQDSLGVPLGQAAGCCQHELYFVNMNFISCISTK